MWWNNWGQDNNQGPPGPNGPFGPFGPRGFGHHRGEDHDHHDQHIHNGHHGHHGPPREHGCPFSRRAEKNGPPCPGEPGEFNGPKDHRTGDFGFLRGFFRGRAEESTGCGARRGPFGPGPDSCERHDWREHGPFGNHHPHHPAEHWGRWGRRPDFGGRRSDEENHCCNNRSQEQGPPGPFGRGNWGPPRFWGPRD